MKSTGAQEALGGQNYEQVDDYDNRPTLGEKILMQKKYGIG